MMEQTIAPAERDIPYTHTYTVERRAGNVTVTKTAPDGKVDQINPPPGMQFDFGPGREGRQLASALLIEVLGPATPPSLETISAFREQIIDPMDTNAFQIDGITVADWMANYHRACTQRAA